MDMNVFNQKFPVMNPPDLNMIWMGQFNPERSMIIDEAPGNMFNQQGMAIMDDLTQQTHAMDMNPMMGMVGNEFHPNSLSTASQLSGHASGIPPDIYGLQLAAQQTSTLDSYHGVDNDYDDGSIGLNPEDNNLMFSYTEPDDEATGAEHDSPYDYYDSSDRKFGVESMMVRNPAAVATQTRYEKDGYKKIMPVKRPGLVLKTPIAYQGDIDPSVIPIQRDGMAVCLRCGAIGVKHSFYTKERQFCSMACAREYGAQNFISSQVSAANIQATMKQEKVIKRSNMSDDSDEFESPSHLHHNPGPVPKENLRAYRFKVASNVDENSILYRDIMPLEELPQIPKPSSLPQPCPQDDKIVTVRKKPSEFYNSYDWSIKLNDVNFFAAAVTCFKHAPGYDAWSNIGVGMKVEVENTDCDSSQAATGLTPHSFWVGTVMTICGYKAQIRYEGFDQQSTHDFWVNLCSAEVHSVGWCATRGKPLIPPKSIDTKYRDWKEFLVSSLSGARTLPSTFYSKINDSLKSRFRCGMILEVVDKNRISQVKVATVHKIVGKRLYVRYYDSTPDDNGFWCHEDSPLIHPVGWATTVGHNLDAPHEYMERMPEGQDQVIEHYEDDSTIEYFKMNFTFEDHYLEEREKSGFEKGMKLEAVDPLNLSSICVATVMDVLKFGYMMIRIDSYDPEITGADWFCYHEKSPCIFPVGFCASNNIPLTPPRGYESDKFDWTDYLMQNDGITAPDNLFYRDIPKHGFQVGMKLECADLMDPRLVCVATISRVVGRLLKVHFDGWDDEYDQWLDCESPDMYPVGWCILVGHKLEGPLIKTKLPIFSKTSPKVTRKKRKKKVKPESGKLNALNNKKALPGVGNNGKKQQDLPIDMNNTEQMDDKSDIIRMRVEPKCEPLEVDIETESNFSSEQPSPASSIRSELKFCSGDERLKSHHQNSSTPSPLLQPPPPAERKVTSYISNSPVNSSKYIPRVIDTNNSPESNGGGSNNSATDNTTNTSSLGMAASGTNCSLGGGATSQNPSQYQNDLQPETWNQFDVAQFLRVNDCTAHCDTFSRHKIDGKRLLILTKDEIIELLGMKVGPALKIFDLIQQLKCKIDPVQSRKIKAQMNKKFL